jgi:glycyl-tRNA synthetase beta chain
VSVIERAKAVAAVRGSEDFESISVAFKRIKNILRQAQETKKAIAPTWEGALFSEPAESELGEAVANIAPKVRSLAQEQQFGAALAEIATMRPQVDKFFDKVMVMVEDPKIRANRLAFLRDLLRDFSIMADFSEIVTEKK